MPARYEIRAELGRGGMGVVYRAFDRVLAREVALKRIRADWLDEEARKRFLREAELSARLAHPGIVRVHTLACGSAGELDLVLELVEGVSLAARLRSGSLAPGEAALLAENLARALAHAHARGVLHRDLKPSNVLLRAEDGAPTLTDFGLARELAEHRERLTRTGEVLGSPACMAPEQAAGELARVGPATDVYGLGAVLFAALTGRPPFAGKNLYSLLRQVLEAPPPRPSALVPSVPRALDAVCLRCLAKAPEDRYPTAAALAEDLARVRRGEPTRAEALAPESNRVASRRSLGAGLLATVLVGGACGALWLAGTAGPEGTPGAANSVRGRPPPPARTRPNGPRPRAARGSAPAGGRAPAGRPRASPWRPWASPLARLPHPRCRAVLFVDDRRLLSAGAEGLRLWELPEALGRRRKPRRLEPRSVFGTEDTFASLARLTQGVVESLFLAGTAEGSVRALALGEAGGLLGPSVRLAARGSPHRDDVESLAAFPPGARYLAAAACQDRVHLLQLGEGLALRAIAAAQLPSRAATVAVAGAGRWLLAGVASRKVGGGLGDLGNAVVFELTEVDTAHRAWPRLIRRDPLGIGELRSCLERPADLLAGTQEGNLRPLAWTEAPTPQEDPLRPAPPWTVPGERSLGSAVLRAAHSGPVRALVRLHDGRILSLSGLAQGQRAPNRSPVSELRLWSPRGDHLAGGEAPGPTRRDGFGLALSPSGERFAVALEGGDGFCGVEVYGVPPP